jgi:uncharacterized protein (TIGR00251 family)
MLQVRVTPRSSTNRIAGVEGDLLRVRLNAAPVDGAANAALRAYLAECFGVRRADVLLEKGVTARQKRVRIRSPATLAVNAVPFPQWR